MPCPASLPLLREMHATPATQNINPEAKLTGNRETSNRQASEKQLKWRVQKIKKISKKTIE